MNDTKYNFLYNTLNFTCLFIEDLEIILMSVSSGFTILLFLIIPSSIAT